MNLSNLKLGQTKVAGDVAVTKIDGGYEISQSNVAGGTLAYDKGDKVWVLTSNGQVQSIIATAKTVVDEVVAIWAAAPEPVVEVTPVPSTELAIYEPAGEVEIVEAEVVEDDAAGDVDTLDYEVNTRGGHTAHRAAALGAVAYALGAEVKFSQEAGQGYRGRAVLHLLAPAGEVDKIQFQLEMVEGIMEKRAAVVSRRVSAAARAAGRHHSLHGCHARRGYLAGFGQGLAEQLLGDSDVELPEIVKLQQYDEEAWRQGHDTALKFAI